MQRRARSRDRGLEAGGLPVQEVRLVIAADYPFLDVLWTVALLAAWVISFWLLIAVFGDIFRRRDIGGGAERALR